MTTLKHVWATKTLLSGKTIKVCADCGVLWRPENADYRCLAKRKNPEKRCKKCGGDMLPGDYIAQTMTGTPDFIGCAEVVTVSPGGPGKLVKDGCLKCVECGWSVGA